MWMGSVGKMGSASSLCLLKYTESNIFVQLCKNVDFHCQRHILYYGPSPPPLSHPTPPQPKSVMHPHITSIQLNQLLTVPFVCLFSNYVGEHICTHQVNLASGVYSSVSPRFVDGCKILNFLTLSNAIQILLCAV